MLLPIISFVSTLFYTGTKLYSCCLRFFTSPRFSSAPFLDKEKFEKSSFSFPFDSSFPWWCPPPWTGVLLPIIGDFRDWTGDIIFSPKNFFSWSSLALRGWASSRNKELSVLFFLKGSEGKRIFGESIFWGSWWNVIFGECTIMKAGLSGDLIWGSWSNFIFFRGIL